MKSFCILEKDCVRVHFLVHQVKIVELIRNIVNHKKATTKIFHLFLEQSQVSYDF